MIGRVILAVILAGIAAGFLMGVIQHVRLTPMILEAEVYEQARRDVMALNKSVLNVALLNGLIDRQAYQRFSNDMFYIPFYRAMEDGQLESIR